MNGPPPPLERYWFTRAEVAKMTGFTVSALAQLGANGEGPAFFKPGGKPSSTSRYFKDDVDDYMRNKPGPRGCQTLIVAMTKSERETPGFEIVGEDACVVGPPGDPLETFWRDATEQAMARRKEMAE